MNKAVKRWTLPVKNLQDEMVLLAARSPDANTMNKTSYRQLSCLAVAVLALASCRSLPPRAPSVLAHGDTIPWQRNQVLGLSMALDDPKRIESYSFGRGGTLAVTFGEKNGMACGPLIGWRLHQGRLFFCDVEGKNLEEELFLVRYADDEVIVRRSNGELARFTRKTE
ncbi:MAG: hypothetical protein ACKOKC_05015 [Chthoniobacterales bacterium]